MPDQKLPTPQPPKIPQPPAPTPPQGTAVVANQPSSPPPSTLVSPANGTPNITTPFPKPPSPVAPQPIGKPTTLPFTTSGVTPNSPATSQPPTTPTSPIQNMTPTATENAGGNGANTPPPSSTQLNEPGQSKSPIFAKVKSSPMKWIPIILGGLILVGVLVFVALRFLGRGSNQSVSTTTGTSGTTSGTTKQVTLTYWGLWEPKEVMADVLKDFESSHPGVLVNYVKQSPTDYRDRLQSAMASNQGPDLFRFHASWVPMLKTNLSPVPSSVMSASQFQSTYYPVVSKQLQLNGNYVGIPLMYDSLVLFYNKDILATADAQPPKTWAELRELAVKLTIKSGNTVTRGGLAIGNASNVEHFSDILALLMLQNGADPADPTTKEAQDALRFYTNFITTTPVWSDQLPTSTAAFARGEVAMMFAPSWRAHDVLALNPQLNFGTVATPTLSDKNIAWATYWAEGVNAQSTQKTEAWELLKYLNSDEVLKKMYSNQSQVRAFGEPYAKKSLAADVSSPYLAAVYQNADQAQDWYMNSYTHDNGINDQIIKYYQDAINAIIAGKDMDEVVSTLSQGISQITRQYGVTSSAK